MKPSSAASRDAWYAEYLESERQAAQLNDGSIGSILARLSHPEFVESEAGGDEPNPYQEFIED